MLDFFAELFEAFAVEGAEVVGSLGLLLRFGFRFGASVVLEVLTGLDDEVGQVVGEDGAAWRVVLFVFVGVFELVGDFFEDFEFLWVEDLG